MNVILPILGSGLVRFIRCKTVSGQKNLPKILIIFHTGISENVIYFITSVFEGNSRRQIVG
jgi:hypothetical protein